MTQIGLVAAGLGIALLPAPLECVQLPRVRYLPIAASGADFSLSVATRDEPAGPLLGGLLGVLDDRSRLACHVQWYLRDENAEDLVHGLSQAIQKRGLPRALLTDNGSAETAAEVEQGLARLGVLHETTLAQVVSAVLGVPVERIRLRTSEPDFFMTANPTGGSRTLHGLGSAMHWASQEIVKNGMNLAADHLESAVQDIEFELGTYRIKGTDRKVRIDELAKTYPGSLDLDFTGRPKVGATFPNGCHIAEVEIDPETGECDIVAYVACDDVGNIINHQIVEGQMQGGITQGAGHIFLEQGVYDSAGQLLTGSFMDYAMPRAGLVGGLTVTDHAVPTATNPLGAKGVGEGGVTGSMPALMNAVMDALRSAGVGHFDMPATPRRIWQALRE